MKKVAAIFDFDGTLSEGESGPRFFFHLLGRKKYLQLKLKSVHCIILYCIKIFDEWALNKIAQFVFKNKSVSQVEQQGSWFANEIVPRHLSAEMMERLNWHRSEGHRCVIVSRSFSVYLRPWAESLGISDVCGTELEVSEKSTFSGKVLGLSCVGPEKWRRALQLLGNREDYTVYAYGDSKGDDELLANADHPYKVRSHRLPFPANPVPTALITGASSGIGFELARSFAKRNYQLVIIGRNEQKLDELAGECKRNHQTKTLKIVKDLTRPNAAQEIVEEVKKVGFHIDVLVNNAGAGLWGEFAETKIEEELGMVQLQINFMLTLTKLVLPEMRQQGGGKILNVGSVYSFTPVPFQGVYSASKAFLAFFSASLREEVKASGISVTLLCPGITSSSFRTRVGIEEKKSRFSMTPQEVAEYAYRGLMKNKSVVIPGLFNKFYVRVLRFVPVNWIRFLIYKVRGLHFKSSVKKELSL